MALTYVQKMVIVVVVVGLALVIPLYVIAPMAFQRTDTQNTRIRSIEGREERYITTVESVVSAPSNLAGIALAFDYHYKKAENRVRLVVSLPNGYLISAVGSSDSATVNALAVLPEWAMTIEPLYDVPAGTYFAKGVGVYATVGNPDLGLSYLVMQLDNENATDPLGTWTLHSDDDTINNNDVWLGQNGCWLNVNETHCLRDVIGELVFFLSSPVDITAWNAQYDALN